MIGPDAKPAATKASPSTYALLVHQSPSRSAGAVFQSTLRGRWTPAEIISAIAVGGNFQLHQRVVASSFSDPRGDGFELPLYRNVCPPDLLESNFHSCA